MKLTEQAKTRMWRESVFNWRTGISLLLLAATARHAMTFAYLLGFEGAAFGTTLGLGITFGLVGAFLVADFLYAAFSSFKHKYNTKFYEQKLKKSQEIDAFENEYQNINKWTNRLQWFSFLRFPFRAIVAAFSFGIIITGAITSTLLISSLVVGGTLGLLFTYFAEQRHQDRATQMKGLEAQYEHVCKNPGQQKELSLNENGRWYRAVNIFDIGLVCLFAGAMARRPMSFPMWSDNEAWLVSESTLIGLGVLTGIFFLIDMTYSYVKNYKEEYDLDVQRSKNDMKAGIEGAHDLAPFKDACPNMQKLSEKLSFVEPLRIAFRAIIVALTLLVVFGSLGDLVVSGGLFSNYFFNDGAVQLMRVCLFAGGLGFLLGTLSENTEKAQINAATEAKQAYVDGFALDNTGRFATAELTLHEKNPLAAQNDAKAGMLRFTQSTAPKSGEFELPQLPPAQSPQPA